jgi:hypothetical protein
VKDRLLTECADAGFGARYLILLHALSLPVARGGLCHTASFSAIGAVHKRDRLQEALPIFVRYALQHRSIRRNLLEQRDCIAEAFLCSP